MLLIQGDNGFRTYETAHTEQRQRFRVVTLERQSSRDDHYAIDLPEELLRQHREIGLTLRMEAVFGYRNYVRVEPAYLEAYLDELERLREGGNDMHSLQSASNASIRWATEA